MSIVDSVINVGDRGIKFCVLYFHFILLLLVVGNIVSDVE